MEKKGINWRWLVALYALVAIAFCLWVPAQHHDIFDRLGSTPNAASRTSTPGNYSYVPIWELGGDITLQIKPFIQIQVVLLFILGIALCAQRYRTEISGFINADRRALLIWSTAAVLTAVLFFPPWDASTRGSREPLWHAPLWHRPSPPGQHWSVTVDLGELVLELLIASVISGALFLTWGRRKSALREAAREDTSANEVAN